MGACFPLTDGKIVRSPIEAKVEFLLQGFQSLCRELEKYKKHIQILPEGIRIKSQQAEILVLNNGEVRINGQRAVVTTPGKVARSL